MKKNNVIDFIAIICCMVLIFLLGTYIFNWKVGLVLVVVLHIFGMGMILTNFLMKPYKLTVTQLRTGNKVEMTGFKRFLILLGFSFIWEYMILKNQA